MDKKKLIAILIILFSNSLNAMEGDITDTYTLGWMLNPFDAKAAALCNAVATFKGYPQSIYWNPAGLAYIDKYFVSFNYSSLLFETNSNSFILAIPAGKKSAFAFNYKGMGFGQIEETRMPSGNNPSETGNSFSPKEFAIGAYFAKTLDENFSFGAGINWVVTDLDGDLSSMADSVFLFDIGVLWNLKNNINAGVSFMNIGGSIKHQSIYEKPPIAYRAGIDWTFSPLEIMSLTLVLNSEFLQPAKTLDFIFGTEVKLLENYFLRFGYNFYNGYWRNFETLEEGFEKEYKLGFGVGTMQKIGPVLVGLDYAFNPGNTLSSSQRVSVNIAY